MSKKWFAASLLLAVLLLAAARPVAQAPAPQPPTPCGTLYNRLLALTRVEIPEWRFHPDTDLPNGAAPQLDTSAWPLVKLGQAWPGGAGWFRATVDVAASLGGYDLSGSRVRARFRVDNEGGYNLWVDGVPIGGIEQQANVVVMERLEAGRHVFAVHVNGSGQNPKLQEARLDFDPAPGRPNPRDVGEGCRAAELLAPTEPPGPARTAHTDALASAAAAVDWNALDRGDQHAFDASLRNAQQRLQALNPWLEHFSVQALAHSHIDMAWLWPWTETVEVVRNTFRDVLEYLREYPDLVFVQSSAQAYAWMEEKYPSIFEQVRQRVREGRWEVVGGMWVEPDLNMPDGESLVRQLLQGTRYFKSRLGVDVRVGWNPDSFGYSWQLPQIYRKSGIRYFVTQKMAWNDTTKFPYQLFWWQSPDGSRVLTYFPHDYTNHMEPIKIAGDLADYAEATGRADLLHLFGIGDHGGGPMRAMLENARRWQASGAVFPRLTFGRSDAFFERIEKEGTAKLPVWNDEMYLEYHRGVYTSQAATKRNNRKDEVLLLDAEKLDALVGDEAGATPAVGLTDGWRAVLFNQFHDVLAGSGVAAVYRDAARAYARAASDARQIIHGAFGRLAAQVATEGAGAPVIVFNPLSWSRREAVDVQLPSAMATGDVEVVDASGRPTLAERLPDANANGADGGLARVRFIADVPALGYSVFHVVRRANTAGAPSGKLPAVAGPMPATASGTTLENEFLRVEVDPSTGCLTSVVDKKTGRNAIAAGGCGNELQAFEDRPKEWDAWNIDADYEKHRFEMERPDRVALLQPGPVRASVIVHRRFRNSTIEQRITLDAGSPRVDIVTDVDWHERHTLLKAAFPLSVQAPVATYEIPFGAIERPTTRNTPAERAKFEVPALRWGDISTAAFGVSLLNDSKYGYDGRDNVLRLSLLRSPTWPDPEADQGTHHFVYSLYPHAAGWREGRTARRGYELNVPLLPFVTLSHPGPLPTRDGLVSIEPQSVIVTAVKKAEDDDRIVLRFYEWSGRPANVRIRFRDPIATANETDLMERDGAALPIENGTISVSTRPYEIKTIAVKRRTR